MHIHYSFPALCCPMAVIDDLKISLIPSVDPDLLLKWYWGRRGGGGGGGRVNSKLNRGPAMQISNLLATCFHCDELYIHLLHPETGGYLPPPTITLHPSHTTVAPGGCAVLECQAEGTNNKCI